MRSEKARSLKRMLIETFVGIVLIVIALVIRIQLAKAWQGDSSSPHVLMGNQLIQHSLFNRIAK